MGTEVFEPLRAAGVTEREVEIFWLVADRLHNREIAKRLSVSVRTVESHVSALLRKLGGTDRQSLVDAAGQFRAPRGSLPRPLSSFVGRDEEVAEVLRLVCAHRLLTLTGPAGAGKTRLALQVASQADGLPPAVLVDLATVPPGAGVARVFADALGVAGDERRLRAALRETLAGGEHWLVVDNCEHVVEGVAALLAELLATTAKLTVLATSHGPLLVAGEVVYHVRPLRTPEQVGDPAAVLAAPSARLFADRAAAASPGFAVTADNADAVAAICRALDGLPLAIELAAARIRLFSPAELVSHLDDRFALLTDGAQGIPNRHRTLEAALRWSYQLLNEDERLLFERCSAFPGDFDYDTAADVLAYPPLATADLARIFPRLLDRSLISRRRRAQTTEYRLLDSVRQFARDQLTARGEAETLLAHHARRHLRRGVAMLDDLRGRDQEAALGWFDRRWADLRAAMRWALDHDESTVAWEFLAGIGTGWEILGARGELFDWLDRLLADPLPAGELGVRSAMTAALLLCYQDVGRALRFAEYARDHAGSEVEEALAELALGWVLAYGADPSASDALLTRAAESFTRLGDDWQHALACSAIRGTGAALADLAHGAELFGRLGDHVKRANCLNQLAIRAIEAGADLDGVPGWLAEAEQLAQRTGNQHERLHAEVYRACLEQARGEQATAAAGFGGVLADLRRIGDRRCTCRCLLGLGRAAASAGDHEAARRQLAEGIAIASGLGEAPRTAAGLRLLAEVEAAGGRFDRAAVVVGAAEAIEPAHRNAQRLGAELLARLGSAAFGAAFARGRGLSVEGLLGFVLPAQTPPASGPSGPGGRTDAGQV